MTSNSLPLVPDNEPHQPQNGSPAPTNADNTHLSQPLLQSFSNNPPPGVVLVPVSSFMPAATNVQSRPLSAPSHQTLQPRQSSGGPNAGKARKTKSTPTRRKLSHDEHLLIVSYWKENYDDYMKSNKRDFAMRAVDKLNRDDVFKKSTELPLAAKQLETLLNYWTKRYKEVADQFKQSGFGLSEDDPDSLKAVGVKKFKYFWELNEFLACRANINPPVLLQSKQHRGFRSVDLRTAGCNMGNTVRGGSSDGAVREDEEDFIEMIGPRGEKGPSEECEQATKRRRISTGATVIRESQQQDHISRRNSRSRSQVLSENKGRNSTGRGKMVQDMLASQLNSNEETKVSIAQTVAAIEKETGIREQEVVIMRNEAKIKEKQSLFLEKEQARKDREERRLEKEEIRKEKEEIRKQKEESRKTIMTRRKMIMEEAEQLRQQAEMYMKLELRELVEVNDQIRRTRQKAK